MEIHCQSRLSEGQEPIAAGCRAGVHSENILKGEGPSFFLFFRALIVSVLTDFDQRFAARTAVLILLFWMMR